MKTDILYNISSSLVSFKIQWSMVNGQWSMVNGQLKTEPAKRIFLAFF